MSRFIWTEENLPQLGLIFLGKVLDKMRKEGATVRFGNTGQGIKPNYQVRLPNTVSISFSGLSHKRFNGPDTFEEKNLSEPFSFSTIRTAYAGTKTR
ncbi:hypothetical protein [Pseudomonas sp. HUK17]|uniref:hypothetical protein n=1 Tax=Pseudomonas sp. HUK17 TaxID=1799359 RepID=UPI00079BA099|nr:hypothetical protein [Pseudomonas sp. HUK17]KXJ32922.1 hypothetical protein AX284_10740 [Pseudomonas sp. HUK17]